MNETNLVRIHEARIAHHVAAVRQIDCQHRAAAILDRRRAVVVKFLVVVSFDIAAGEQLLDVRKELDVDRHHVFEMAVRRTILDHPYLAVTLDDLGLDLTDLFIDQNANFLFAAKDLFARLDHAVRAQRIRLPGKPSVGFVFCHDLRIGLSDHLGVNEGFGLYLFTD